MIDFLLEDGVILPMKSAGKKYALQELARRAATLVGVPERLIVDRLLERERLGTTGMGRGIAIPHAKLPTLQAICGLFGRLERPIDFEAIDGQPVDMIFMLLAPEESGAEHLRALARVARLLRDPRLCARLRGCDSPAAVLALFGAFDTADAA